MASDDRKEHPERDNYHLTRLIDVVLKVTPYIPQNRINKWIQSLNTEDLDYLIDLMRLSDGTFSWSKSRFSAKLHDVLYQLRLMPIMEVRVVPHPENHQICIRENYSGCYVDRGGLLHDAFRVFVKVSDRRGLRDSRQMVCYKWNADGSWRFHEIENSAMGYYGFMSTGDEETQRMEQLEWKMNVGNNVHEPITVEIKSWNC